MVEAHHHRPTLKQTNKRFKSKHATKSALKDLAKGRVPRQSPKSPSGSNANSNAAQTRLNRRNTARQTQANKRTAIVSATRLFNGPDGTPRIVSVVPLCPDIDSHAAIHSLAQTLDVQLVRDDSRKELYRMRAERFKTSVQFIVLPYHSFYATLDACKVSDYVLFLLSPTTEVDQWGDTLLRSLQSQGLPTVVSCIPPTSTDSSSASSSMDPKSRAGVLKSLLSFMQYFVPSQSRVFDLSQSSDRLNAIRAMAEGKPADVRWRDHRPWILVEQSSWTSSNDDDNNGSDSGRLLLTGVIRGAPLSADRLIHLPNFGDFQIANIMSAPLPRPSKHTNSTTDSSMQIEPQILAEPNDDTADSLVSQNDPDDMANEQTWPTEEEMNASSSHHQRHGDDEDMDVPPDANAGTTPKRIKKVPKGISEYQVSWIIDDGEDDEGEDDEQQGHGHGMDGEEEEEEMEDLVEPGPEEDAESERDVHFADLDEEEEIKQLDKWRNRDREKEEQEDLAFPDEIDTPQDVPARTRFARYRGMKSFRTSPWDPYENLPRDYARIFQFEDYKRTERSVIRRTEETGGVEVGTRVTVTLKDVPQAAAQPGAVTAAFGLLQHEHKKSVLNFTVQRNTEYEGSVRSKDPLIMCIGPRRLRVNPIYSQHTRGGGKGANNVHKFERFLRHGATFVATVYGSVCFGNQPAMFLRETQDSQAPELVAMGTFMNPDTTRIIAKRIILSGHPFKVHKKTATVRYMFFNPDDIAYFKPIALTTKHGRTGHIRESLGTHGYFKAHFDGPITQMDTICMSLYKRVFPKWTSLYQAPQAEEWVHRDDVDDDAMQE